MKLSGIAGLALGLVSFTGAVRAEDAIKILGAVYGTPSARQTCDAIAVVARICDGKTSCDVLAGNQLCGDPDFGTTKTLDLEYLCGSAAAKSVTVIEQSEAHLSCR